MYNTHAIKKNSEHHPRIRMEETNTNILCVGSGVALIPYVTTVLEGISRRLQQPLHTTFAMMSGSGEGAVPLMMVACQCFDIPVCVQLFRDSSVEGHSSKTIWNATTHNGYAKEEVLRAQFKQLRFGDVSVPIIIALRTLNGKPLLVRSWDACYADIEVVDILMAATARPVMYPPVMVNGQLCVGDFTDSIDAPVRLAMEACANWPCPKLIEITMNNHHDEKHLSLLRSCGGISHTGYLFWEQMGIGKPEFYGRDEDCKINVLRKILGEGNLMSIVYFSDVIPMLYPEAITRAIDYASGMLSKYHITILTWLSRHNSDMQKLRLDNEQRVSATIDVQEPYTNEVAEEEVV